MAKKKNKISDPTQISFLENYGRTAPAVPAIKEAVTDWRENGYKGSTETTKLLLNHWFYTDHRIQGKPFKYYPAQQEAIESIIYTFEVAKTRTIKDLYEHFVPADLAKNIRLEQHDPFARYATKMATGSGKTKVMSLAIAWQYFNSIVENLPEYARTFLIIAPNLIVFERLSADFIGGRIFNTDPVIPKSLEIYWSTQFYVRGDTERVSSEGGVYVTNIQQLYENPDKDNEPNIMTRMLGSKPPSTMNEGLSFRERILQRDEYPVLIINDEAHHTHDAESTWNETIRAIATEHKQGISAQLDFSATPRHQSGALFGWVISDYTLKQAILDGLVKRPVKGLAHIGEVTSSSIASVRYAPFITAGVERWREYRDQLKPLDKKPILFVMMNDTEDADSIGEYLRQTYPSEFGNEKTLVIHVYSRDNKYGQKGDIIADEIDSIREAARKVDAPDSPINAIVSVLMLREGWDVQNVTVIVGLRPFAAKAEILPEQTIGRGLRLMFRELRTPYQERVDIIGNPAFIQFVEQLEKDEDLQFETWQVGKDRLVIVTIEVDAAKAEYDISVPVLSPILARSTSLAEEIEAIDVAKIGVPPLPRKRGSQEEKKFRYEALDIITLEPVVEREYKIPTAQTPGEIISYYAQVIAKEIKLPGHFSYLAPKVRDFFKYKAFGEEVNLEDEEILQAMSRGIALHVVLDKFKHILKDKLVEELQPTLESEGRLLSGTEAFPWSRQVAMCRKTIFNQVPCENNFEEEFAKFLDNSQDVHRFAKLPLSFGFAIAYVDNVGNLRYYYPDFVVVDTDDTHYLVETKGREDIEVANKDRAAIIWCENATRLTGKLWKYVKVLQDKFKKLRPTDFGDCVYFMGDLQQSMFDDN
jgi:type III restriction enzyme